MGKGGPKASPPPRAGNYDDDDSEQSFGQVEVSFDNNENQFDMQKDGIKASDSKKYQTDQQPETARQELQIPKVLSDIIANNSS